MKKIFTLAFALFSLCIPMNAECILFTTTDICEIVHCEDEDDYLIAHFPSPVARDTFLSRLTEGNTYRIKVSGYGDTLEDFVYTYWATYTCDLNLIPEEFEMLDVIDYGTLEDGNGNGLYHIAADIPYDILEDFAGDYEGNEVLVMAYRLGFHYISTECRLEHIQIEIFDDNEDN